MIFGGLIGCGDNAAKMVSDIIDYHETQYHKRKLRLLVPEDFPLMFLKMQCAKGWTLIAVMSPNLQQFSLKYQLNQVTKSIGVVFVQSYGKKEIDRENKITAQVAHTILLEQFKFTEVMVLTDFSKA